MQNNIYYILEKLSKILTNMGYSDLIDLQDENFIYILSKYGSDIFDYEVLNEGKMMSFQLKGSTFSYSNNNGLLVFNDNAISILKNEEAGISYRKFILHRNSDISYYDIFLDNEYIAFLHLNKDNLEGIYNDIYLSQLKDSQKYLPDKFHLYTISNKKEKLEYAKKEEMEIKGIAQKWEYDDFLNKYRDYEKDKYDLTLVIPSSTIMESNTCLSFEKYENDILVYQKNIYDYKKNDNYMYLLDQLKDELNNGYSLIEDGDLGEVKKRNERALLKCLSK